jgi:hypothetical protein
MAYLVTGQAAGPLIGRTVPLSMELEQYSFHCLVQLLAICINAGKGEINSSIVSDVFSEEFLLYVLLTWA